MGATQVSDLPPAPDGPDRPLVLARVYPGYHEAAVELFQMDAENLAHHGWLPVAQSYAEGRHSQLAISIAVVLILVAVGVLMLLYMGVTRPPGNLAVTYMRRDAFLGLTGRA